MEKTLIIGAGEIGTSLGNVLSSVYEVVYDDIRFEKHPDGNFNTLNICYPYSDKFVEITKNYINKYQPKLTIIHSTVRVGTTRKLGKGVVYSPINGRHPHLELSIKTFIKFIGGISGEDTYSASEFFRVAGIKTIIFSSPEATEFAKIFCTTYYGWNLIFTKEMVKLCEENNLPFHEVYTIWNNVYNEGYMKLNESRFLRPVLLPMKGEIGGHCVIPNCDLFDSSLTKVVKQFNATYKEVSNEDLSSRKKCYPDKGNRQRK